MVPVTTPPYILALAFALDRLTVKLLLAGVPDSCQLQERSAAPVA